MYRDHTCGQLRKEDVGKRVKLSEFEKTSRARRGSLVVRNVKTNPYYILNTFVVSNKTSLGLKYKEDIEYIKLTDLPIVDRNSTGTVLSKMHLLDSFVVRELISNEDVEVDLIEEQKFFAPEQISLDIIDDTINKVDDILEGIEK